MIELTLKQTIILKIITLVLIISLICAIQIKGKDMTCDKCQMKFINEKVLGKQVDKPIIFYINVTEMYLKLMKGECILTWSQATGFGYINSTERLNI